MSNKKEPKQNEPPVRMSDIAAMLGDTEYVAVPRSDLEALLAVLRRISKVVVDHRQEQKGEAQGLVAERIPVDR
jgi:hypothetical protein